MKRTLSATRLAEQLGISKSRALEATIKAQLVSAILGEIHRRGLTHADLARRSGLSPTTVTDMLSGSRQKVTIDRVLLLVEAARLEVEVKLRRAARQSRTRADVTRVQKGQGVATMLGLVHSVD